MTRALQLRESVWSAQEALRTPSAFRRKNSRVELEG